MVEGGRNNPEAQNADVKDARDQGKEKNDIQAAAKRIGELLFKSDNETGGEKSSENNEKKDEKDVTPESEKDKDKKELTKDEIKDFINSLFEEDVDAANSDTPENEADDTTENDDVNDDLDNNQDNLTPDEINELQKAAIKEAFERIARGEKLTDAEKGNLGEMLMDQYYISKGYTPIHSPRVTDLKHKSGQGIDGVYEKTNPDGTRSYIIADAKVNHSKLNKGLADGTDQMSDDWVEKRLDNAVGKEMADEIRDSFEDNPDSVKKEVYHFSYGESVDGSSEADTSGVDSEGNQSKEKTIVQVFDKYGNVVTGG